MPVSRAESDSLNRFAMAARASLRQLELGIETELDRVEEVRKREQRVSRYYSAPVGGPALDLSSMAASYGDVFAMSVGCAEAQQLNRLDKMNDGKYSINDESDGDAYAA